MHHFNCRLTIDGEAVKEAGDFKFFGVHSDRSFKSNKHTREVKSVHEAAPIPGGFHLGRI